MRVCTKLDGACARACALLFVLGLVDQAVDGERTLEMVRCVRTTARARVRARGVCVPLRVGECVRVCVRACALFVVLGLVEQAVDGERTLEMGKCVRATTRARVSV